MEQSLFQASLSKQLQCSGLNEYNLYGNEFFMVNNNNSEFTSNADGLHIDVTTPQHKNTSGRVNEAAGTSSVCAMANGGQGSSSRFYDELHASDVENHFMTKSKC